MYINTFSCIIKYKFLTDLFTYIDVEALNKQNVKFNLFGKLKTRGR